jgi:sugar transferase (PEP-CTERM system associated)
MGSVKIFNHHFRTPFLILLVSEYFLLFYFCYLGVYFRFGVFEWQPDLISLEEFPLKASVYSVVMLLGMFAMGQYESPGLKGRHYFPVILQRITISLILGSLGLLIVYYIFPNLLVGRGILAYSAACSLVGLSALRTLLYHTVGGEALRRKILVLGVGELASNLLESSDDKEQLKNVPRRALTPHFASYSIHGFVQIDGDESKIPGKYLVNTGDDLSEYCQEYKIDEIVVAISDRRKKLPIKDLLECKLDNINCIDFVAFWEREKGMLRLDMLNPSWMIFNEGSGTSNLGSLVGRLFDIGLSFIILAFMFPVLLITALLIFVESGFSGPIFYKQVRVGFNGKTFNLLKFRSMIINAEKNGEAKWASQSDSRITRVGRFIRKVRIDELPQVLNIFRGDMSIVGPRPERPEFVEQLETKIPFYSVRHSVKPGLAGWAQLKYPYGASEEDAYNKLQYDLYYVKNHSVIMDALILLQTVEVILLGKGVR